MILTSASTVRDNADMIASLDPFGPPLIADMVRDPYYHHKNVRKKRKLTQIYRIRATVASTDTFIFHGLCYGLFKQKSDITASRSVTGF